MDSIPAYVIKQGDEIIDHADTLADARHLRDVCAYGGIGTLSSFSIERTKDGRRFT